MTAGDDRDLAFKEPLAWEAVDLAPQVICAVRDADRPQISRLLDALDRQQLYALVVTLAAAFDPDSTHLHRALEWAADWTPDTIQPCGTHSAFVRHKTRGETPDRYCVQAERDYQRASKSGRRARGVAC